VGIGRRESVPKDKRDEIGRKVRRCLREIEESEEKKA